MDEESKKYLEQHQLDGVVRIPEDEYSQFPAGDFFMHFMLGKATIEAGKRYAFPRILEHGHLDLESGQETLPKLSFENIYKGECKEVRFLVYDSFIEENPTDTDFVYSFTHIQDIQQLHEYLFKRYSQSRTHLTLEAVHAMGVTKALFRIAPIL